MSVVALCELAQMTPQNYYARRSVRCRQEVDLGLALALVNAFAAATTQELEINRLKSTMDDMQVIQSALCAQVREMTARRDLSSRRILELEGQFEAATQTIQARDQELAALRNAILDGAHLRGT